MKKLIKPKALKPEDTIATITLSAGHAGKFLNRYYQGKSQFENSFGVKIIETPNALKSPEEIYDHPEWRLNDLMWALEFRNHEKEEQDKYVNNYQKYDDIFLQVCKEYDCQDLAIVTNMDFGHPIPQLILPYGALAEIDPISKKVSIIESAVI